MFLVNLRYHNLMERSRIRSRIGTEFSGGSRLLLYMVVHFGFAVLFCSHGKACIARYVSVWHLIGTRIGHYLAAPLKSTVDGRLKEKSTVGGRLRKKKGRGRRRRRRGKEERRRRGEEEIPYPCRPRVACEPSPPAGDFSPRAGREIEATVLSWMETEKGGINDHCRGSSLLDLYRGLALLDLYRGLTLLGLWPIG
ncbi:hypothetical protein GW17_00005102 [Ensete ventricosum]|nr:hypothetical protein GW17_00005102 [Ensete ventricosum]RZR90105.1 hypothetical protein BHM03_00017929 [Ensete ventricosum]